MANKRISQLVTSLMFTLSICITAEASEVKPTSIMLKATTTEDLQKLGSLSVDLKTADKLFGRDGQEEKKIEVDTIQHPPTNPILSQGHL